MSRPYFSLLSRDAGPWAIEFGDYDREVVASELEDRVDHFVARKDLRIIKTGETQAEIVAAVAALNEQETARLAPLVAAVKRHAVENYETDGFDYLVECWDDAEIAHTIRGAKTEKAAIAACRKVTKLLAERRSEVVREVF
jgi:hypothetical protein